MIWLCLVIVAILIWVKGGQQGSSCVLCFLVVLWVRLHYFHPIGCRESPSSFQEQNVPWHILETLRELGKMAWHNNNLVSFFLFFSWSHFLWRINSTIFTHRIELTANPSLFGFDKFAEILTKKTFILDSVSQFSTNLVNWNFKFYFNFSVHSQIRGLFSALLIFPLQMCITELQSIILDLEKTLVGRTK